MSMKKTASVALVAAGVAAVALAAYAQIPPTPPQAEAGPTPRHADGSVRVGGAPAGGGNWEGPANATLCSYIKEGKPSRPAASLPENKTVEEIPFKPGVKELYMSRIDQAEDPHTRCKPSGGSRFWHTPYGIEIVNLP